MFDTYHKLERRNILGYDEIKPDEIEPCDEAIFALFIGSGGICNIEIDSIKLTVKQNKQLPDIEKLLTPYFVSSTYRPDIRLFFLNSDTEMPILCYQITT